MTERTTRKAIEISLLGGFQVRVSGTRLGGEGIPGRKAPGLLKLLALERGHQLVRDQAMALLWPGLDSPGAAAQLYKAIHELRKALGAEEEQSESGAWIATVKNLVILAPPGGVITDVATFEQAAREALASRRSPELARAAALYTGDLLPTDLYAAWTQAPRDHLRQLYIDVLAALAADYHSRGDLAAAAETYRAALDKDATLEVAHRGLMTIFARQGQRDRALKQYGVCLDALAEELGVAPSQETRALYAGIERQEAEASVALDRTRLQAPLPMTPLVGRESECRVIDECLAQLTGGRGGRGGVLLIEGPAGIGKTRLVRELMARAQQHGCLAFAGSAYEMEGKMAYGPFLDILQAALPESATGQVRLPAEIAAVLSGPVPGARPVPNSDPRAAQAYLFAGVADFLRQRAVSAPLVVVLENAHAADSGSHELFHFLARRLQDVPVLLVASRRKEAEATGDVLDKLFRSVREAVPVCQLALGPLNAADHYELLLQQGGARPPSRQHCDELFQVSEGNPMYALELFAFRSRGAAPCAAAGTIPPSLRNSVAERLVSLTPAARELLTIAAVAGEGVSYPLLEKLWPGDGEAGGRGLLDVIDQLIAAQLLYERGIHYHFRHALHRQCVYESASAARRRAMHARVAHSLVSLGEREADLPVEQIAFHYQRAGDARQAAHFLMLAGQRAAALYAHEDALRCYRDALALLEPAQDDVVRRICGNLYTLIGDTGRASGYLNQSCDAYERAMSLLEGLPVSAAEVTDLHRKIALVAIFGADMQKAGGHLAEAWRHVGDDPRMHARLHILRALYLWHFNRLEEAAQYAHRALEVAESARAPVESAQACEILAMAYLPLGRWQEGLRYEKQRLRQGRWSPELVVATDAHLCLWEYHVRDAGMLDQAANFMREVAAEAGRLGDLRCVAICRYALGSIHLWQGDTAAALEQLDESVALHDKVGSPAGMAYALARLAVLHTLAGDIDAGWQSVLKGIEQAQHASIRDHCLQRLYGAGIWNRLLAGDAERVAALVAQGEALLDASGPCTACGVDLYPWLALNYLERGDVERGGRCAQGLEQLAAKTGNPVGEACAAIVRCGVERAQGNADGAREAHDHALELMRGAMLGRGPSPITYLFDRLAAAR